MYEYKNFKGTIPSIIKHFNLDLKRKTIYDRLEKGMSLDEALEKPVIKKIYKYKEFEGTLPEIIRHFNLEINKKLSILD